MNNKRGSRTAVVHVYVTPEEHEMLYFVAQKEGKDMSKIVRDCIHEKYKNYIWKDTLVFGSWQS